ncbi:hypothetical protein E4U14_007771 [Claviceps sp. LM454 group G7]|nr:hypothetical protein E4U14_007771 [Claviceps sp. LM454 group G7]
MKTSPVLAGSAGNAANDVNGSPASSRRRDATRPSSQSSSHPPEPSSTASSRQMLVSTCSQQYSNAPSSHHQIAESMIRPRDAAAYTASMTSDQQLQQKPSHNKRRGSLARETDSATPTIAGPSGSTTSVRASSAPKRAKTGQLPPKILPQQYEFCAVEDIVELIAHMLAELIATNDAIQISSGGLTRFHSRTAPGISVRDYLHRLARHATLTPPLLLAMVYYIDRLCALYSEFTINTLTVHRFLITAATVAAKGLSDSFWNNTTYARVGGVRLAELKLLELEFLYRVDWKIVPNPEVLVAYYQGLVQRTPQYELEHDDSSAQSSSHGDDEKGDECNDDNGEDAQLEPEREDAIHHLITNSRTPSSREPPRSIKNRIEDTPVQIPTMRPSSLLASVCAALAVHAASQSAEIYIQAISSSSQASPLPLAEISYDLTALASSSILSYEAPEVPDSAGLVRIGIYDPKTKTWTSGTTVASTENFAKGYSPTITVNVNQEGHIMSAAVKGVQIDAGQTRDFGPKVVVLTEREGAQPVLNKPIVLTEGKKVVEDEKTFLQKYWWMIGIAVFVALSGGGGGEQGK